MGHHNQKNLWGIFGGRQNATGSVSMQLPGHRIIIGNVGNLKSWSFHINSNRLKLMGFFLFANDVDRFLVIPTWWNTEGFLLEVASISLLSFKSPDSNVSSNYGNNLGKQVKHYGYISSSDSAADWWLGNLAPKWSFHHTKTLQLPLSGRKCPAWKRLLMKSIAAVEPATCTRT